MTMLIAWTASKWMYSANEQAKSDIRSLHVHELIKRVTISSHSCDRSICKTDDNCNASNVKRHGTQCRCVTRTIHTKATDRCIKLINCICRSIPNRIKTNRVWDKWKKKQQLLLNHFINCCQQSNYLCAKNVREGEK